MGFNQFGASLALRLFIIMVALSIVGFLIVTPGYHAATLLGLFITAAFTFEMFKFITKTNQEVTRFLDAARYADFGQRFGFGKLGAGFPQLEQAFTHILERFREDRTEHESELRHLKALLEHVPVPLISIHASNQITLWNNSARRLFGISRVTRLADLEQQFLLAPMLLGDRRDLIEQLVVDLGLGDAQHDRVDLLVDDRLEQGHFVQEQGGLLALLVPVARHEHDRVVNQQAGHVLVRPREARHRQDALQILQLEPRHLLAGVASLPDLQNP